MNQKFCSNCGADAFIVKDGYKICKYCNSRYSLDEGDVPKTKTVVSLQSDIERLLQKCKEDPARASKYAGLILDIDPTNREARKYL